MGNQESIAKPRGNNRRRSLPNSSFQEVSATPSRPSYPRNLQTINQSLELPPPSAASRQYRSIDYESVPEDKKSIKSDRLDRRSNAEQDRVLQKLGQKNQDMRKQLKKISEKLSEQIKKKRFIPKKKVLEDDEDDYNDKNQANAGLRRELENGYRQIEMYKRTIEALKGKNEEHQTDLKLRFLQNTISSTDAEINLYIRKLEGLKRIKKGQDKVIEKDINDDLKAGVASLKKELQDTKKVLKEYTKRERQREGNYKRQQAYLFEVQKKYREINGDYFPELKKKTAQAPIPINSRVTKKTDANKEKFTIDEFFELQHQLNLIKRKHEDYHKKIDGKVLNKNKMLEERTILEENIKYSDKVIEALKLKLKEVKKIQKPAKKSIFGYDSYTGGELQSQYNGGVDQIEKEIEEQNLQDQFDIKHLIANIPKPSRPKIVVEFQDNGKGGDPRQRPQIPRQLSADQRGMVISGEKAQPKKWGSSLTREEERGRGIKNQSPFNDSNHLPADKEPLIIGVNVWVNKNNAILGIQGIYLIKDEIRYGAKSSGGNDGFLQRFDLQSPDYIKNITGAFSDEGYLEYLIIYSKQGKIGTFGFKADGQDQFTFGLSATERPFKLSGASFIFNSEPRLNKLGIEICHEQ